MGAVLTPSPKTGKGNLVVQGVEAQNWPRPREKLVPCIFLVTFLEGLPKLVLILFSGLHQGRYRSI